MEHKIRSGRLLLNENNFKISRVSSRRAPFDEGPILTISPIIFGTPVPEGTANGSGQYDLIARPVPAEELVSCL